ncbi:hypothetical protein Ae201684P_014863 [Aphanomyces euteiches]|nr:hypothetical protein Ae201684P_014863 [Aphanomyces euteiches]
MVREDKTPAEMWQTLIDNYEKKEWSNTIYVLRRLCELKYDTNESETVEWILVTLPNDGPDNFNAFINHLKPTPNQEIGLKTLISALLNEEEKRKERKRSRSYHHSRERDHKKPKENRSSYANITHEINALTTKLSTIKNVRKSDGKWCFICRKTSDHVAQDHDDFDPNFRDKEGKGARPKDYSTSKASFTKTPLRKPLAGSNDDENWTTNGETHGSATSTLMAEAKVYQRAPPPEENHLAEKTNEYLFNKVRVYMTMSGLPAQLWGYALDHVVYVYNNTPQELLNQRTPYEVLFAKPSRLHMLKTFRCLAYMYVPKSERASKLSNPAVPCVFVGYAKDKLGYLLYNPKKRTIQTSRSVKFDETKLRNANMFLDQDFKAGCLVIPSHDSTGKLALDDEIYKARFTTDQEEAPILESTDKFDGDSAAPNTQSGKRVATRKSARTIKKPKIYEVNSVSNKIVEPQTFRDVDKSEYRRDWIEATNTEYQAMLHNSVWELVPLPADRKALKCKWVWKAKYDADGSLERFKARLCPKGYLQIAGVDFTDTYAPVLRLDSLRLLCALVATLDLETAQLDVKTAFLNGDLDEDIYMEQPERYQVEGKTHLVCKLNKSIYGLKQAPRQWNKKLNDHLASIGFKRCNKEQSIYVMVNNEARSITYLAVYVDDIVIGTRCKKALDAVRGDLTRTFEMSDKGELNYLLGMRIERDRSALPHARLRFRANAASARPTSGCETQRQCQQPSVSKPHWSVSIPRHRY